MPINELEGSNCSPYTTSARESKRFFGDWGLVTGDWGLGIRAWPAFQASRPGWDGTPIDFGPGPAPGISLWATASVASRVT